MDARDKLKTGDVAKVAAGPGRSVAQTGSRFTHWREAGIIPADETVWGPGGPAYVFPQSTGAVAAVLFDLFDAGVVTEKQQLGDVWRFNALHRIKRETGACVVVVAHTGKNEKAGIRGHRSK